MDPNPNRDFLVDIRNLYSQNIPAGSNEFPNRIFWFISIALIEFTQESSFLPQSFAGV